MSKTTYKMCQKCNVFVRWEPPQVQRYEHSAMYPWTCLSGNAPRLCGLQTNAVAAAEQEVSRSPFMNRERDTPTTPPHA